MMEYSRESLDRQKKIQDLKDAGVVCYANNFRGKQDIVDIRENKDKIRDADNLMQEGAIGEFKTAGRVILSRAMGKLLFVKLRDNTADIQVCFMKGIIKFNTGKEIVESIVIDLEEKNAFKIAEKYCQIGDYIGAIGDLFLTKHGELTLFVKEFQILSKAVRPLPEKFHGVQDQETIYRQRYLDLIMNEKSYDRFKFRSEFINTLRSFYHENGFIELETSTLGNSASGAAAKPFITHHNDFGEDFYLKISDETQLKKATVGRFERVFEIDKDFRNEGSDPSHLQEFTMVEHYVAWWNFEDNIEFTQKMFNYFFNRLKLDKKIPVKDKDGNEKVVDFSTPWEKVDYVKGVNKASGIDITKYSEGDEKQLIEDIKARGLEFEGMNKMGVTTLIDYLYKKVLRPSIVGPAIVYNYPKIMQPLARISDNDPNIVEQFQVIVNGWEIVKAYSELVDPKIQKENFEAQSRAIERGDEEVTSGDDDFVLAMEYAMPPQSGFGMGIDRIVSILTQQDNLRDVVLFPLMKDEKSYVGMGESKETMLAVAILNKKANLERWQELNTIAHLNAAFGARAGKSLFMQDKVTTHDGYDINLNIQHAIIIKETSEPEKLFELLKHAKHHNLEIAEFIREMIITSDDKKIEEITKIKEHKDMEYLGVLIFGKKKDVEKLTKEFSLYS